MASFWLWFCPLIGFAMTTYSDAFTINVTVGVGYKMNFTAYVVKDYVTWYTARTACKQEVTSSHFNTIGGTHCILGLAKTLSEMNLEEDFIWMERVKPEDDNVYRSSCNKDQHLSSMLQEYAKTKTVQCVGFNLTHPNITFIGTDSCNATHPYICWKRQEMDYEYVNRTRYENVTVTMDTDMFNSRGVQNETEESCDEQCTNWFRCVGFIYYPLTGICRRILDMTHTFDLVTEISLTNETTNETSSEVNVVMLKMEKRYVVTPNISRSDEYGPEIKCDIKSSEEENVCQDNLTVYTCSCTNTSEQVITLSTVDEWKANITSQLQVDKKTLSSFKSRLTSAKDSRMSSAAVGAFGIILISVVIVFIVINDIITLCTYVSGCWRKLSARWI